ncbi:unnamed protein product [Ectocarpus sp. 8 AP-2014]
MAFIHMPAHSLRDRLSHYPTVDIICQCLRHEPPPSHQSMPLSLSSGRFHRCASFIHVAIPSPLSLLTQCATTVSFEIGVRRQLRVYLLCGSRVTFNESPSPVIFSITPAPGRVLSVKFMSLIGSQTTSSFSNASFTAIWSFRISFAISSTTVMNACIALPPARKNAKPMQIVAPHL